MTLQDLILAATGGPTVQEGLLKHYQQHGATSSSLRDAEREFLVAYGADQASDIHSMWTDRLMKAGYAGDKREQMMAFWKDGGTFSQAAPVFVGIGGWQSAYVTHEGALFSLDLRQFFLEGGAVWKWSAENLPAWMSLNERGLLYGSVPWGALRSHDGIVVTGINSAGNASTSPVSIHVEPNVSIVMNPTNKACGNGDVAKFTVHAQNATGYQWFRGTQEIPGANGFVLTLPVKADDNGAEFYCRVNGHGGVSLNTAMARLIVL